MARTEAEARRISVQGVELSVTREGAGPPVVCLHAVGHSSADFDSFSARFRAEYEVIRVDWPGHGASGADAALPSTARYAELLGALVPQLGIEPPILLGNSIGGGAAILYATQHPVTALILCDSAGLVAVDFMVRAFCAAFAAFFAQGARGARWYRSLFSFYYRRIVLPGAAASARRERIIAEGYARAPILRDAWRSFGRPEADLRETLLTLRVPIWFAWAKHDRVIPFARVRACLQRVQNGQISLFEAGHAAFLECPSEFAEGFARFVKERLRPAPAQDSL